ncbi:MAG: hypothetical protein KAU21_17010, partial [Gammaproteobacteria bacterium]|nr:hypothetical protein [Gammaproteobacteria bacterium]
MSTVINSINYLFNPDKNAQALCEYIADDIDGNGALRSDITAEAVSSSDVTVTSEFSWAIQVSLKSRVLAGKTTKNFTLHDDGNAAQLAAKKQGQQIILKSLGKIELVNNINDDPEHFYKHSSVKLSGGPAHAFQQSCTNQCNHGALSCPRCHGKGSDKATTKKEDFLGTSPDHASRNICPQCKGKGTIQCHTCSGSGEITNIYEVMVTATRHHKDIVDTEDSVIKAQIEHFIAHQSHKDLFKTYLTPVVHQLEDIDQNHSKVIYRSKTKFTQLKISLLDNSYNILGFGNNAKCINKPRILDEILIPAITDIIGSNAKINSTGKFLKLQSIPLLSNILDSEYNNRSDDELEFILNKRSNQLLSQQAIHSVLEQLSVLKDFLTPRYSLLSWLPFIITGILSAIYFGLPLNNPVDTGILIATHIIVFVSAGYLVSSTRTKYRRKK